MRVHSSTSYRLGRFGRFNRDAIVRERLNRRFTPLAPEYLSKKPSLPGLQLGYAPMTASCSRVLTNLHAAAAHRRRSEDGIGAAWSGTGKTVSNLSRFGIPRCCGTNDTGGWRVAEGPMQRFRPGLREHFIGPCKARQRNPQSELAPEARRCGAADGGTVEVRHPQRLV